MEDIVKDLRFAVRTLARTPVLSAVAVLSLAIGIGANTTIFSAVNALFLRGLPIAEPDRVVSLFTTEAKQGTNAFLGSFMPVSRPNYEDLRDRSDVFSDLADFVFVPAAFRLGEGEPEQTFGLMVSGNYFPTLGISAASGRLLGREDDLTPGGHPIVVLSHAFWSEELAADPQAVGRTVTLNDQAFTVVGIAPKGFQGTFTLASPAFWVPIAMRTTFLTGPIAAWWEERRALLTFSFGRLAPGVSIQAAQAAITTLGSALEQEYPVPNANRSFVLVPIAESAINPGQRGQFLSAGAVLMGVVGLVLLIACVNVANLLLGRAAARRKEMAIRMSQGAARGRLLRQLLTESLLLAVLSGGLGLALAHWGRAALWAMRPQFLQQSGLELAVDARVLVFTIVVSLATGVLFGLAPALRASRPEIVHDLKDGGLAERGIANLWSAKNLLVVSQVALSFVALIFAGLFLRSLGRAAETDLGFRPESISTLSFDVGPQGLDEPSGLAFFDRVVERAESVPGITAAAVSSGPPLSGGGFLATVLVEGRDRDDPHNAILTNTNAIDAGYFGTLGIPLLRGRAIEAGDRAETARVVVLNKAAVERFWPNEDPIGRRFHFFGEDDLVREVVGVVGDTKLATLGEEPQPQIYLPVSQYYQSAMTLVVSSRTDPAATLETLRREVQALAPSMPLTNVQTMPQAVDGALWGPRSAARLLGAMGTLALALAAIGLYGVMSFSVARRQREIGIRIALGAQRTSVVGLVLGQGLTLAGVGLALGLVAAILLGRQAEGLLYGIRATDPLTLVTTAALLLLVATFANLLPAFRAAGVDPVRTLRAER